jgi:hypothetical protein
MLNRNMRGALAFAIGFVGVMHAPTAHAEGAEACNPAYEEADGLVRSGGDKLLDAREKLRTCARSVCKPWMVKECTKQLADVEARIPSVVLSAKDASGAELVDVTVTSGDATLASRLDGHSIEIGPGERRFVFALADGRRVTVLTIVKEGDKAQRVSATFEAAKREVVAPPPASQPVSSTDEQPSQSRGSTLRTVGFVAAGAGIVGLGIGAVFGIKAVGNKSDAMCNENNECKPGPLDDARSSASVATVGFVAGALLVAAGVTLIFVSPSRASGSAKRIEITPSVAQRDAGLLLRGTW